jgi:8-oxo-dGTP pyrophosphatase MutT (NUDIX family)
MANDTNGDLKMLLDILRAIAQEGLSYSKNEYDTARYEKLMEIASKQYAAITGLPQEEIRQMFRKEQGSITPKVGVDAAVKNNKGEILVLQREDNGAWCVPGGWADVDESPFQTAKRETLEETGLSIEPAGYIGIASKTPLTHPSWVSQINICIAVKPISPDKEVTLSHEHTAYKWINNIEQINNWHTAHKPLVQRAFSAYRDQSIIPNMDNH